MVANTIVAIYRRIPGRIRGWVFRGWKSNSHLYIPGDGIAGIIYYIGDSKPPRPPMPHE